MDNRMRILIVEDGHYYIYGKALADGFQKKGFENVRMFSLSDPSNEHTSLCVRIQNKLACGPDIKRINNALSKECELYKPDLIFMYRCRIIYPSTVRKLKLLGTTIFLYNNDNPFATYYPKYFWRHYRNAIRHSDMTFVYREKNIEDCIKCGAKQTELLRSYYIDSVNYPIENIEDDESEVVDVVFLGHYENDDRTRYISALTSAGISVGIPSATWEGVDPQNTKLVRMRNTHENYNRILNRCKIALVFLSSLNEDTYTRRCFEIPATKTFMLAQYTDDQASMFEPDKEAVYFNTSKELVEKTLYYLKHEEERERIAKAGYDRLMRDGHEIGDRVQQILDRFQELTKDRT